MTQLTLQYKIKQSSDFVSHSPIPLYWLYARLNNGKKEGKWKTLQSYDHIPTYTELLPYLNGLLLGVNIARIYDGHRCVYEMEEVKE